MRRPPKPVARWAAIAAAAIALYALLGFVVVPWVAKAQIVKAARTRLHREARIEKVTFNPFTLTATISGFELRDRDSAPLLTFHRLAADLEVAGVFRRALRLREFRLDTPVVHARILADGHPSIADLLEKKNQPEPGKHDRGMPRVIVDHLVVAGGRLAFEDASRSPVYSTTLEPLGIDLRDLTTIPRESGDHSVTVRIEGGAEIRWSGRQTVDPLRLEGRLELDTLRLWKAWDAAGLDVPLEVPSGTMDIALSYLVERGADEALHVALTDGALTIKDLAVHPRGGDERWLGVERLAASGVRVAWPERTFAVDEVRCERPEVFARRAEDGTLNWTTAMTAAAHATAAANTPAAAPAPWSGTVGAVVVEGGAARIEDRMASPAVTLEVSDLAVRLAGLSTDTSVPIAVEVSARLLGQGTASARGSVTVAGPVANLEVSADALDLVPLRPYLAALPRVRLASGAVGARGTLAVRPTPGGLTYDGAAWLAAAELQDDLGGRLLACREARAEGIRFTSAPTRLRVETVAIDGGFATVHIDKEGNLNLVNLSGKDAAKADPGAAPARSPSVLAPVYVGTVRFRDAAADFTDESLILPFGARVHTLTGTVTDLATVGAAPARVALEGRVDETGFVSFGGTLRVADPFAATDLQVTFRSVNMERLTPYAAEFAGYSIQHGALDLDIRYRFTDRRLVGEHRVVAHDLTLGGKVQGAKAALPIRLAVALLKDKEGRIDLDVPVEGSVDSPEFAYRKVVWQAVKIILGNIVKAPFRALGRLFGKDEEDLELVGFEPGRSALIPPEQDKLATISAEIASRTELTIEVEGRFDPAADAAVLRSDALEALIAERRVAKADAVASDVGVLDAILEELYVEAFSPEALGAERARFTAAPPAPQEDRVEKKNRRAARKRAAEPPPPAPGTFDAEGFYDALRARLLAAQRVESADLAALANARAAAIAAAITAGGQVDPTRVTTREAAQATRKKRAEAGLVASEMTLTTPQ